MKKKCKSTWALDFLFINGIRYKQVLNFWIVNYVNEEKKTRIINNLCIIMFTIMKHIIIEI